MVKENRLIWIWWIKRNYFFLGRTLGTDLNNYSMIGWTEAIAVDKFLDETVNATICHGMKMIDLYYIVLIQMYEKSTWLSS